MERSRVKNKNPAPIQITAEQLVREAQERQEPLFKPPEQKIANAKELQEYRQGRRMYLENKIRRDRFKISVYIQYAQWEESQHEVERARSVFERGLEIHYRNASLWLKYVELELRHKNVNHCRNLLERATHTLPRMDMFWYKYVWMEEMLGETARVRALYDRWVAWEPAETVWLAFLEFEKRQGTPADARRVLERLVGVQPTAKNWIRWARFEETLGSVAHARAVYEACQAALADELDATFFVSFARFEMRQRSPERARALFQAALERFGGDPARPPALLLREYASFEKQYGDRAGIEGVVLFKRRKQYEAAVAEDPHDYDAWVAFAQLEEEHGDAAHVRAVYERAVAQVPPVLEKPLWARYVYLWLFYAVYEEAVTGDIARADAVLVRALDCIPHGRFSFAKVWTHQALLAIRRLDVAGARAVFEAALAAAAKPRLFKAYIELELELREFDRVRALYERFLEFNPANCAAWLKYAELEVLLGDTERARGVYDIAIEQPVLDSPETVWTAFIDFEVGERAWDRATALYERLLERTQHLRVWLAYAAFARANEDLAEDADRIDAARRIFERGAATLKARCDDAVAAATSAAAAVTAAVEARAPRGALVTLQLQEREAVDAAIRAKQDRLQLLRASVALEEADGDADSLSRAEALLPEAVKARRRRVVGPGGRGGDPVDEWEEYRDHVFPGDSVVHPNQRLLALAHQWKARQGHSSGSSGSEEESGSESEDDRLPEGSDAPVGLGWQRGGMNLPPPRS